MVILANAIVDPVAMMVKLVHALIADITMPRVFGIDCFTIRT